MKKIIKLSVLALVVIGLASCGRIGDLETVKTEQTSH